MAKAIIIGCGGVGSWLAYSICKLIGPEKVLLIDGDTLEEKNLDRQLFSLAEIGCNKAKALADNLKCECVEDWYSMAMMPHDRGDMLMVAVDNHPARKSALDACDFNGCKAIFGANETHSAEAYYYHPDWKDSKRDPRVYYPEILTVLDGDPRGGQIGCTGEAQKSNPQLVTANFMAAAWMQHLFVAHAMEGPKLDDKGKLHLPFRLSSTLTRVEAIKTGDIND